MTKSKDPKALRESEAFYDNPDEARRLWDQGLRPMRACDLKPGMVVAYVTTDVFGLDRDPSIAVATTLIGDVLYDPELPGAAGCTVTCSTFDRGNVECDDGAEVWAMPGRPVVAD